MEGWSRALMWSGSVLVYIGWLYNVPEWRFYRHKKSLAVFVGYFLWALLIILILNKLPVYNSLIILAVNMVYSLVFLGLVSEVVLKSAFKYSGIILFLGFVGQALFNELCELGGIFFSGRAELLYDIYVLLCAGFSVAVQKILLERGKAYQRKQRDREKQLIKAMEFKENMEFQEKQYAEMAEVYDEIRKIRHDMRNSFMIIEGLLEQGLTDEARKYLNLESEEMDKVPPIIQTESVVISTLLNRIFQKARKAGVQISCKIITDFSGIREHDLCRLLGNLLDNALEAVIQLREPLRYIDLVIQGNEHRMLIEIENSSDRVISGDITELRTTKEDGQHHGLGLKNVSAIVENYEGNVEITGDGKRVRATLILFRRL